MCVDDEEPATTEVLFATEAGDGTTEVEATTTEAERDTRPELATKALETTEELESTKDGCLKPVLLEDRSLRSEDTTEACECLTSAAGVDGVELMRTR